MNFDTFGTFIFFITSLAYYTSQS